jgi:hypothetical protein
MQRSNISSAKFGSISNHNLKEFGVGRWINSSMVAKIARFPRSWICIILTTTLHCGDRKCSNDKILERSCNRNHDIDKEVSGSWWWIVEAKAVWTQTALGSFRNHMLIWGPIRDQHVET